MSDRPSTAEIEFAAIETAVTTEHEPPLPHAARPTAVGGAVWTIAGFGVMQVLRFAFNLILQRLLDPAVFGVTNLVNTFIQGLHMFSDLGIQGLHMFSDLGIRQCAGC